MPSFRLGYRTGLPDEVQASIAEGMRRLKVEPKQEDFGSLPDVSSFDISDPSSLLPPLDRKTYGYLYDRVKLSEMQAMYRPSRRAILDIAWKRFLTVHRYVS